MEAVANGCFMDRRRRKLSNGHVVAQLLEAPLRTPRRSCCGPPAPDALIIPRRFSADLSPRRRLVPFSWETSPGVPRSVAMCREVLPPKPPPPPPGPGALLRRASRETTTDGSSEDGGGDTFSDAMNRTSSSDRLAALSARLSSMGSVAGSRRSPSFIMDRFLPAANAIATTSADIHPRRSPSPYRRSVRRDKHDEEEEAAAIARARHVMNSPRSCALVVRDQQHPKQQSPLRWRSKDAPAQSPLSPRSSEEERGDDTSAKVCGLMFFFPWRAKPVLLGFPLSSPRNTRRAPNASVTASVTAAPSPPRRSVTLSDVLEKERRLREGGLEKSGSGRELARIGWGTALLGTSKRYCADARKAMSRLTRSATDGTDGPRLCREQRGGKQGGLVPRSMSEKMPPLSPPSESWLCHARRSSAGTGSSKR